MQVERRKNPTRRMSERPENPGRRMIDNPGDLTSQLAHHLKQGQFGDPAAMLRRIAESNAALAVHQALRSISFSTGIPQHRVLEIAKAEIENVLGGNLIASDNL